MIKYITEMSTEIEKIEKLLMHNSDSDTIVMYKNASGEIFITNNDSEEFDASTFFFTISKEDWNEIKLFIDKQFQND